MATLTPLVLIRPSETTPWGFRLVGGADYKSTLRIQRVTPGSIASQHLTEGDILVSLEGEDAKALCHFDACDLVKHSGTRLSLTVRKASSIQYLHEENKVHQEKLEQIVVEEQKQQELERKFRRAMSTPPRDATASNRSTPQRMISSPANAVASPRPVLSPPSRVISPSCPAAESTGTRTPQNVLSPCRMLMSPSAKPVRGVQQEDNFQGTGSPLSWVGANPISPVMRHVVSPIQRNTPPSMINPGNLLPGACTPPVMSPPLTSLRSNVASPPNMMSPPLPRHPHSSRSIDRVSTSSPNQPQSAGAGDLTSSSYSTPTLVLSPNQFQASSNPNDGSSGTYFSFPPREEQGFEPDSVTQEKEFSGPEEQNLTADAQRRQLQLMIQEKLRLEEKMMIAKRREGSRTERMSKNKSVTTQSNELKSVISPPQSTLAPETTNSQLRTVPVESKTDVSRTLVRNAIRTVQQEVLKASTSVQERIVTQREETKSDAKFTTITKTNEANQTIQGIPKAINPQEEANRMLDKLKKTARDKIAEFQKSFSLNRCVDETEQLREANRIRDEEIRKMQEHNLNQKQGKTAAKSTYSADVDSGPKGTDLRKVKTESKPGEREGAVGIFQSEFPVTDSLDGNASTVMSSVSKPDKKEVKGVKKDVNEVEKAKLKEQKKREDLKKIQEQFKKDQLLIQEEMKKKEAKALREKKKLDEIETKQKAEVQSLKDAEDKKLLAKIIYEEEQKLLAQKKIVEEKMANEQRLREEEARQAEVRDKIAREKEKFVKTIQAKDKKTIENENYQSSENQKLSTPNRRERPVKKSIKESYESLKMKAYEQKRVEMQKAVQVQHVKSARQLNDALKRQSSTNLDDPHVYEDVNPTRPAEKKFDTLKQEEERQMLEEARQYEEYRRHLESKRKTQVEDSDDYASEWDESSEASIKNFNNLQQDETHDPEEPFDELKATSEEELLEAQEKSIRNLERQIRKQKEKDRRRNSLDSEMVIERSRSHRRNPTSSQVPSRSQSERRPYSSTGDLRKSNSRTLPVTKFSPDPMEFGFKPIESPTFSKSMSNLDKGGSAESGAAVAGAQAGAKATGMLVRPAPTSSLTNGDLLVKTQSLSASLGDLQQVCSKPPLPTGAARLRLRHATSDELLCRAPDSGGAAGGGAAPRVAWDLLPPALLGGSCPQPGHNTARRYSYAPGEDLSALCLGPQQEGLEDDPEEGVDFQTMEYYNRLLSEYYSAYYEAYYLSYYRKQQEELKAGKTSTMNGPAGPPPPPPPPPFVVPGATPPPVVQAPPMTSRAAPRPGPPQVPLVAPPAALAGAMMKDKKPFTYTPGGLDLSEIRSPRMQRRLSRNAALEGVKPSPLAQPQQVSSPGIPSPAASSGIAVQVLPMPGMSMAKAPSTPPPSAKTKEPPPIKKNVCGPAPPPPPFAVGVNGALGNNVPTSTPVQTPTKVPVSPVSPVTQTSMQGDGVLNTPSSPPFSSQSSDPRSPSPSLVSTESGGSNAIPAPPPMPPQCATARRASLVKSENQALPGAEAQTSASERLNNAENISPAFSATTDSNRSVGSSSMAVEDETTSYREDSVTPSHASNHEKASVDNQYSSNESLLKQISALEQITARHQSKSDHVSSSKENVNKNATLEPDVPVQPILRLSTKPKISEAEERSKREAEEKAKMEEEQRRREEQARLEAQEKEKERIKKEKEQERIRQEKEQERIRQEKEQERIKKEKEQERIRQEEEKERIRHEKEKERIRQEKEKMEEECRRQEEARVKEENERLLKIELENKKKMEEEQRKQQALEKQRIEEARKQKEELQRLEEERQRTREIEIQKQRDIEWKKQEEEWRKLRELEIQQQRELESHKFDDEARSTSQKLDFSPGGESGVSNQANVAKNRRLRQGSVPVQLRGSALSNTPASQRHSTLEAQQTTREMERNDTESPNISPTTGLVRVPLPWMSAVPRRETSAPPEFVNYAQGTQTRLQQQHLQRAQRQQSQDYSKVPSGPSPVFKEAVVSSPPVVYQHPGGSNIKLGDSGRSTLPRQHKPNVEKTLSGGPALRPWAVKHQEYQQQKLAQGGNPTVDVNRARYHQRDGQQGYSYGQAVQTPPSSGGGSRWPEVQPPSFLRQSSTDAPAVKNPPSTGAKVRIVPIVMEQDSSSETEQAYGSADSSTPTYVFNSGNRTVNPQSVGRFTGSTLPKNPPHPQGQSPISPPSSKWSPNQPQFKVVRPGQPATAGVQKPQSSPVYYNNPIGMYSEGNAVEALQQMQQSLAQLNSGLQNPAPAPDTTPVQSRSFRVLQQVVDSEVSGSDDEIRGFMSQDEGPISYQTAQSKTFTGGPKGRGPRLNNSVQSPLARQNYPEPFGREPQAVDNGPKGTLQQQQQQPRGFGNNSNAIPSRAFRALQQQTGNGAAGPGESDL